MEYNFQAAHGRPTNDGNAAISHVTEQNRKLTSNGPADSGQLTEMQALWFDETRVMENAGTQEQ